MADLGDTVSGEASSRSRKDMTDAREQVAAAMMRCSLATGHGDTLESLLAEMEWQVNRLQNQVAQHLSGCQLRGPGECQKEGKCLSASCVHYGKTEYRPRMTLEARVDGILYPPKNGRKWIKACVRPR